MGKGFLQVELFVGDQVLPVKNAEVLIKDVNGNTIKTLQTDENGLTEKIELETPDIEKVPDLNSKEPYFAVYDVEVPAAAGYKKVIIHDTQIFDHITSYLPIHMEPAIKGDTPEQNTEDIYIPKEHGVDLPREASDPDDPPAVMAITGDPLANEVAIPEYVTVHLGSPNAAARNVRVPFKEYIKVICC